MSKYEKKLKPYIIDHVRYNVGEKYLLCTACTCKDDNPFNIIKTEYLYLASGKVFMLVTNTVDEHAEIVTEKFAHEFMNAHPGGINEENYIKFFGEPGEP